MKPLVSQLWPQFMADPDFAACFGKVMVEHALMLRAWTRACVRGFWRPYSPIMRAMS